MAKKIYVWGVAPCPVLLGNKEVTLLEHSICPPGTALRTTFRLLCTASDEQTEAAGSALAGSPQPRGLAAAPGLLWQMKLAVRVLSQVWLYPLPVATF